MKVEVRYSFFGDEQNLLPPDAITSAVIPDATLLPMVGDVVFLGPRSAWTVAVREWDHSEPDQLTILVWLAHSPDMLVLKNRPPLALVQPKTQTS